MKLNARQLQRHLTGGLARIYLVSGDEPLMVAEALDAIRARARRGGFEQRELFVVDKGFRWNELESAADNLSLFATRRIVELRLSSTRPGEAGGRALRNLAESADPDRLVLVAADKLDSAASRAPWVKAIEANGVLLQLWPIERESLPAWIRERAQGLNLKLTQAGAELLADRVEGNLLAADQELKKLALSANDAVLDEDQVLAAVANSARFDVFRLVDALLAGESARTFRILASLRAEGAEPAVVSWAIGRELCLLARLQTGMRQGLSLDAALASGGVWRKRQPLIGRAAARLRPPRVRELLRRATEVDRVVKGVVPGNPWQGLTQLVFDVLGSPRRREVA